MVAEEDGRLRRPYTRPLAVAKSVRRRAVLSDGCRRRSTFSCDIARPVSRGGLPLSMQSAGYPSNRVASLLQESQPSGMTEADFANEFSARFSLTIRGDS